jgi:DNA-directed RNA polymerase subunit RPC12/RpoP
MKPPALLRALFLVMALGLAGTTSAKTAAAPAKEQAPPADPNESCMMCHADASAKGTGGKSIGVDAAAFAKSVHGEMQFKCTDCHADVSVEQLPHPEKLKPAACANCHEDAVSKYKGTAHAKALAKGHDMAASCRDCHGSHDIKRSSDPSSKTNFANIEATCGACHGNDKIVEQAHLPGGNIQSKYHDSIHNQLVEGKTVYNHSAPTCTSCHGAHNIQPKSEPDSRVARAHVPDTCGGCHQREKTVFVKGMHGQMQQAGNAAAPVCIDCHGAHTIQRASTPGWQNAVVGSCGNCHDDKITSFRLTYHGKVTTLGPATVATCASCHGAHDVRPASDPLSTVNSANLLSTCRNCHANAGAQLVSWDPHPQPKNKERSILVYYTNIFMEFLLAGVFLFFGLHTVLWAYRSFRNIAQRRKGGGH